jgi:hypothetical protein
MHTREEQLKAFDRLLTVMDELREKCPWDRKQTFESLRQNTIEETYELATALLKNDMNEIAKELGVYDTVKTSGWGEVSSRNCGHMVTKAIEIAERNVK